MNPSYVESVWWALKQIHSKGLLVEDYRVAPYCPRCGTGLSDHELAQGYETVTDPSVFVRFPLTSGPYAGSADRQGASLLVWTTTPWTLVSNTAVAVHPDVNYVVVGESGSAAGTVGRHAVVLDEQTLAVDLLQCPPDRFDVGRVHRAVGVLGVDPVTHPLGHLFEPIHVAQHRLTTLRVELGHAVRLDVALAGEAELLLDGELDRQPVAVPTALAVDLETLHRLEPREDVFEDAGLDVVGSGEAVRRGGPLVERPRRGALVGVLVAAQGTFEGLVLAPKIEHAVLERGEVHLRRDGAVLAHWSVLLPVSSGVAGCIGRRDEIGPNDSAAPAVPPSLVAQSRWETLSRGHRCRFYSPVQVARTFFRRLRVIFAPANTPGLTPSPGRSRLCRNYSSHRRLAVLSLIHI